MLEKKSMSPQAVSKPQPSLNAPGEQGMQNKEQRKGSESNRMHETGSEKKKELIEEGAKTPGTVSTQQYWK
ncbi:hypothetical protein AVO41_07470 [Thiomicrospira sp. WB1]|nr:hypothetical protein AVO41_07470 [Thiomicrospira sp. WB1]